MNKEDIFEQDEIPKQRLYTFSELIDYMTATAIVVGVIMHFIMKNF